MGRVSFGAAQDFSGVFSAIYNQYIGQQRDLAARAERRALEIQEAADREAMDRWQAGEMSDTEFRAYVVERIAATEGLEPERNAYWKNILLDFDQSVLSESIALGAEQILDRIMEGQASWTDLLNFYKGHQSSLPENSPLFDQLRERINEVNDRIVEGRIQGEIEEITYLFTNNQITGTEAGRRLRALADKYYKTNDPQTYYQMLTEASKLEQFGGLYSSGGGGGRGGGGGTASRSAYVNTLEGVNSLYETLIAQAKAGERTGTLARINADGSLTVEEIPLRGPDGNLLPEVWPFIRDGHLANMNELIALYTEGCNLGTEADCQRKSDMLKQREITVLEDYKPLNSEDAERQGNLLLGNLGTAMEALQNSTNPEADLAAVQRAADALAKWQTGINATTRMVTRDEITYTDEAGEQVTETRADLMERVAADPTLLDRNPELKYKFTGLQTDPKAPAARTTDVFGDQAMALATAARMIRDGTGDLATITALLTPWLGEEADDWAAAAIYNRDKVAGLADGTWGWVVLPNGRAEARPLAQDPMPRRVQNPDGTVSVVNEVGPERYEGEEGAVWRKVMLQVGRDIVPGFAPVMGQTFMLRNETGEWVTVDEDQATERLNADAEADTPIDPANNPNVFVGEVMWVPDSRGRLWAWFQNPTTGLWHRNGRGVVEGYGGLPTPISFDPTPSNVEKAQEQADILGIDDTGRGYMWLHDTASSRRAAYAPPDSRSDAPTDLTEDWLFRRQRMEREQALREARQKIGPKPSGTTSTSGYDPRLIRGLLETVQEIAAPKLPTAPPASTAPILPTLPPAPKAIAPKVTFPAPKQQTAQTRYNQYIPPDSRPTPTAPSTRTTTPTNPTGTSRLSGVSAY